MCEMPYLDIILLKEMKIVEFIYHLTIIKRSLNNIFYSFIESFIESKE